MSVRRARAWPPTRLSRRDVLAAPTSLGAAAADAGVDRLITRVSRRAFVGGVGRLSASAAGLALLSSACALLPGQTTRRIPVVGYLSAGPREAVADEADAFVLGLRDLGYEEGRTIAVEWRFSPPGIQNQFETETADLVRSSVDLIVVNGSTTAAQIVKRTTSTIPIVAVAVSRPVESGLAISLARPGGNLTALSVAPPGMTSKDLDLLREVVPGLIHLVMLVDPANAGNVANWEETQASADAAGLQALRVDLHAPMEIEAAFDAPNFASVQAVFVVAGGLLTPVRARLAELALQHRLPAVAGLRPFTQAGLLMSYGPNTSAIARRAATYVDKILKGAKAGDIPVEQPTAFDFVVNTTTLQALGLTIPSSLAPLVTEWIP